MSDTISLAQFLRFCHQPYGLPVHLQRIQDPRQAPQIPTPQILVGLITGAALGLESLRQLDRFFRQPAARRLVGRARARGARAATVARVLGTRVASFGRAVLWAITAGLRGRGYGKLRLPDRGPTRVGVVDGSSLGKVRAGVLAQIGEIQMPEDLEPWEKRGKELPAGYRLLRRVVAQRGQGFVELPVGDGLYMTQDFFRFCREELGCHGVGQTDEETVPLRQDADGLFNAEPRLPGGSVRRRRRCPAGRGVSGLGCGGV